MNLADTIATRPDVALHELGGPHHIGTIPSLHGDPWANALGEGVTGSGTTDDAPALNSLLDDVNVLLPPPPGGSYLIASQLNIPSGRGIFSFGGPRPVIKVKNSTQIKAIVFTSGGEYQFLRNVIIDCNKANQTDSGTDGNQVGVQGDGISQFTLENVTVKNSIREGFYITNSGWNTFFNCYAEACNRSGFEIDAQQYGDLIALKALNCLTYGVRIVGAASLPGAVGPMSVLGGFAYGCGIGLQTQFARATQIDGFKARQCTDDGILIQESADINVRATCDLNERHGLYILSSSGVQVPGGNYRNNNRLGAKGGDGIRLNDSFDCEIGIVRCNDTQASKTQIYGIRETGTSDRNEIYGGNGRDNNTEAFALIGAGSVFHGKGTSGSTGRRDEWGTGSPEGVVTAAVGSVWHRTDGGAATCLYIKESGTGNTGWIAK